MTHLKKTLQKLTNVSGKENPTKTDSKPKLEKLEKPEKPEPPKHGGAREGAGRKPKQMVRQHVAPHETGETAKAPGRPGAFFYSLHIFGYFFSISLRKTLYPSLYPNRQ